MTWKYIAQRISGPSAGTFLDWNLPLRDVEITNGIGPSWLTGVLDPEMPFTTAEDDLPLFDQWSTAIWAQEGGVIRGGGILTNDVYEGPKRALNCMGYAGYPKGIPWTGEMSEVQIDPLEITRRIWNHVQSFQRGNLGVLVDATTSPVRLGTPEPGEDEENPDPNAGPYELNWWDVPDCGDEIDALSKQTPFDYSEEHAWRPGAQVIEHRIRLGYPRLGRRRHDLRFVLGENIKNIPVVHKKGSEFANEILGIGAGEGRDMIRLSTPGINHRLRRVYVLSDKSVSSVDRLRAYNKIALDIKSDQLLIDQITVMNHLNARIGSWAPGDEILVQADVGWTKINVWCRVRSTTIRPDESDIAVLALEKV